MPGSTAGADFGELLRELKDRSGLSYGVLAKRLHMSTSTLHRYCNGDAVPTDYAPVERLARLCKASPDELVELHRRWVLADAMRGWKGVPQGERQGEPQVGEATSRTPSSEPEGQGHQEDEQREDERQEDRQREEKPSSEAGASPVPVVVRRPSTRRALLAAGAVAAVLGAVALVVSLPSGEDGKGAAPAGAAASGRNGSVEAPARSSASPDGGTERSASPRASDSRTSVPGTPKGKGASTGKATTGAGGGTGTDSAAPPLTVTTRPYTWEDPCSQRYLINRPPTRVAPPPNEDDAPAWVAAHGAVSSGDQYVTLTVQGTGKETVVIDRLTVHMAGKRSPLAWNDYAMVYPGVGCGGGVPARSFTVALDAARPAVLPESGHRNFPFKVSESDPEVYYIKADASAYDVSWYLELTWSSGARHGTLRVDDHGRPFRTSGNNGRPAYEFPLGGSGWVKEGTTKF
ncbi:helix-turn-helix domain-containing protein [Streptomyces diastatochromogenes]|uniref:helix-turn-helix domain-containing protein n=1 Tax=Streptomyces diastatochromogenes TaxID=42236 RepID=UPI00369D6185